MYHDVTNINHLNWWSFENIIKVVKLMWLLLTVIISVTEAFQSHIKFQKLLQVQHLSLAAERLKWFHLTSIATNCIKTCIPVEGETFWVCIGMAPLCSIFLSCCIISWNLQHLCMRKLCTGWVPYLLTPEQKPFWKDI